ncbi:hypothetical protein C173_20661 [Paenibacillus sp. FSL R7-277]|nr:hypothetical protein C173_20661 [Paenibacillus sp. FSL R7-277]
MHQDFILNTTGGKIRQLSSFVRAVSLDGFDQSNSSDGDQVFHVFAGVVEFLEVVDTLRCQKNKPIKIVSDSNWLFLSFEFNL